MSKTEKLSHYAIMIVAVSALVVSVWQVRTSQEHNRLSVRPYLDFFSGWEDENSWQIKLSNEGVGPAIIKEVDYVYAGKTYHQVDEFLKAANLSEYRINSTNFGKDSPFANERSIVFLKLNRTEKDLQRPVGARIVIHYESIYEEPFESEMSF